MTVAAKLSDVSRRSLLTGALAGCFLFAFHLPVRAVNEPVQPPDTTDGKFAPNAFIRIDVSGRITLVMPQVEMGQGVYTAIAMILAEELEPTSRRSRLSTPRRTTSSMSTRSSGCRPPATPTRSGPGGANCALRAPARAPSRHPPRRRPALSGGMIFWSAVFNPDTRFTPDTSKSPQWNRGAYLAEALAHCGECHTPRNLAFALDNRKKFAGAVAAGWHAFNITSDKATGVGGWSDTDLASYLASGHANGHGTASGPMGEAVDRSFSQMTPDDIKSVVAYMRSVPAIASPDLPETAAPPAPASHRDGGGKDNARGKLVFEGDCVSCHGWTGESVILPMATLTGAAAVNDPSGTNVAQIVLWGTICAMSPLRPVVSYCRASPAAWRALRRRSAAISGSRSR